MWGMLGMLGSFGRCNIKIGKLGMTRMKWEMLGMNGRNECGEC